MATVYELHAKLSHGRSTFFFLVGRYETEEGAQAALAEALRQGPWVEPAEVTRIEIPDPIDFGPRTRG